MVTLKNLPGIKVISNTQQMHFGFTNVIILHSDHRHGFVIYMVVFRVVRTRILIHI